MPKYWSYNYYSQPNPKEGLEWWASATEAEQSKIANGGSCVITSLAMVFYPNTSSAGHASTPVGIYRQNGGLSALWQSLGDAYGYEYGGMIPVDGLNERDIIFGLRYYLSMGYRIVAKTHLGDTQHWVVVERAALDTIGQASQDITQVPLPDPTDPEYYQMQAIVNPVGSAPSINNIAASDYENWIQICDPWRGASTGGAHILFKHNANRLPVSSITKFAIYR